MSKFEVGQKIYCACSNCREFDGYEKDSKIITRITKDSIHLNDQEWESREFVEKSYEVDQEWEKIRKTSLYKIMQEVEND